MESRIYHGEITPAQLAQSLLARYNRENLVAQQVGDEDEIVVQIATRRMRRSGGRTALTVTLQSIEDGVAVQIGRQAWLGVAASLGMTALSALKNPFSLIGRLDDLAQDFESLQLNQDIWQTLDGLARFAGASHQISERLRRLTCSYCRTANPVGQASCLACGAPLGDSQPGTCSNCGYVVGPDLERCPNCNNPL
jgi:RNA polymerase subunit RPABC4/transcription elongation factor Spt4